MRDRLEDRHRAFDVADLELVRRSQEGFLQLARAAQCDDPTAMDERVSIDDRLALEEVVAREKDGPPPGRPRPESRAPPDPLAHFVRLSPDVGSAYGRLSSGRTREAREDAEACRLSCAVRAEQSEDFSLVNLQGNLVQGSNPGIILHETGGLDKHLPPDVPARR